MKLAKGLIDSSSVSVVTSGCPVDAGVVSVVAFCSEGGVGLSSRRFGSTDASLMRDR